MPGEGEGEDLVGGGDAGAAVGADGGPVGGAERGEAAGQVAGGRNVPSAVTFSAVGALTAPGMWPATGSTGSVSPRYRSPARASSSTPSRASAAAPSASSSGQVPRLTR